ncbi:MAG TPA: filamentous hemagglutinin N-terminal domain-containing protein, partial [Burkholderiaceae bacterium]|nr:filamentous hemagglutinin N-terminal domain-containing protein [Burkholderiaceae bacterium]
MFHPALVQRVGAPGPRHVVRSGAFRPALLSLALASAFAAAGAIAQNLPTGAAAIHGQASVVLPAANRMVVTTQNGAGTGHSAINWQSFSISAGSSTRFDQPNAASLSINRVVTNTPSAIFGNLSSNGRLVLVNQSGITVGAGAVIDTAGFTASALRMTDADALAGRLRFGDASASMGGAAGITVDGRITARDGDVVLVAPQIGVGASALLQAPNGSTILAAGQLVEITGRGLEGISLLVQARENEARNLGRLEGDAVGIFAGTLRHSGEIQATTASLDGG